MIRVVLTAERKREVVAAAKYMRAALPSPAAMKRAALEHLRRQGVRFPMRAGRPVPDSYFDGHVLELARRDRFIEGQPPYSPHDVPLNVTYYVPVRVSTPWGAFVQDVELERDAYLGTSWTCSSPRTARELLKRRAVAARYRFVLLVMPDGASTERALRAVRGVVSPLRVDTWDLDAFGAMEDDSFQPVALRPGRNPHARSSAVRGEFRRFVEDLRDERRVRSRVTLPLTAARRRANEKLTRLLETDRLASRKLAADFEAVGARVRAADRASRRRSGRPENQRP